VTEAQDRGRASAAHGALKRQVLVAQLLSEGRTHNEIVTEVQLRGYARSSPWTVGRDIAALRQMDGEGFRAASAGERRGPGPLDVHLWRVRRR